MKRNISETITAAFETCNLKGNHHRSAASSCSQGKQSSGMGISWDVQGYTGTAALMGHPHNIAVTANKNCCLMLWPQTVGAGVEWGWGKDVCQGQRLPLKASEESCTVHYFWRWQSYSNKIYKRIWERLLTSSVPQLEFSNKNSTWPTSRELSTWNIPCLVLPKHNCNRAGTRNIFHGSHQLLLSDAIHAYFCFDSLPSQPCFKTSRWLWTTSWEQLWRLLC